LSSVRIVTTLVGIHSLVIVKKASVKFEQALLTSNSSFINFYTGNISLLDPILITDSIQVIDSGTVEIDRQISDHDGTCVTFKCGFSNQNTFQHTIWDYIRGDYILMKQKMMCWFVNCIKQTVDQDNIIYCCR
jgi:hypothetical protein